METERRWSLPRIIMTIAVLGFVVWRLALFFVGDQLEIAPETTFVNGPLTADGLIDYETALHERLSDEITSDNNAAVLIDRAFGPKVISLPLRTRYFMRLGIAPLAEQADYVVTQEAFTQQKLDGVPDRTERQAAIFEELGRAQQRPWTRVECPLAAEWLAANEQPLELIEEATKRPRYYSPLVTEGLLIEGASNIQNSREAARLLVTRAMFRLDDEDVAGAWSDLLACHRLARLIGQRPQSNIQSLVAVAVDAVATAGDAALIAHGLSAEQARQCLVDHTALAACIPIADAVHLGERLVSLDSTQYASGLSGSDINVMLRRVNRMFDGMIAAMKLKDAQKRRDALAKVNLDLDRRMKDAQHPVRLVTSYFSRKARSNSVSDIMDALMEPAFTQAQTSDDRTRIKSDLVRVGFALAAYRAEQGNYPMALDVLVPKYLSALPPDRMNDLPLRYVARENGFSLYSVGPNGRDDGGSMTGLRGDDDIPFDVPRP